MNAVYKTIKTCLSVLIIGIVGAFTLQSDAGRVIEEAGLDWLFKLRGAVAPPEDVIIVSIDQASAEILHFPDNPENWPRSYYAELIRKINRQAPAVIAFNLHFAESRDPGADRALAGAMRAKKNVIVSNYLKQDSSPDISPIGQIRYEPLIEPIPLFSHAAFCSAPFPLPKISSTVKEIWMQSSGGVPTFPLSIFQYFVIKTTYPDLLQILGIIDPDLSRYLPETFDQFSRLFNGAETMQDVFRVLSKDEATVSSTRRMLAEPKYSMQSKSLILSITDLLEVDQKRYLNYYGDVGAIPTIPFYKVLADGNEYPEVFKDKIVLVGYSDDIEPEKYQGFYTTFSIGRGKVISPIEIAATAVANAIDRSWIKPLPGTHASMTSLLWGVFLSALFRLLTYKNALLMVLLSVAAYAGASHHAFSAENLWLPVIVPSFQALAVVLWQSAIYLLRLRTVSGTHLPKKVIDEITRKGWVDQTGISMSGVCMATDIDKYTALSEEIGARQIAKLINEYNAVIYPKISARQGIVLNNIGDAILAGWVSEKTTIAVRKNACHAALEIKAAIDLFNSTSRYPLMTRIGLHYGEMDMGFVGANGRYEYRAVGDTVNTSTRIEGLNKLLGTRILVSEPVLRDLPEFFCRRLGFFLLRGRSQPVMIYELIGFAHDIRRDQPQWLDLAETFARALERFESNQWELALEAFAKVTEEHPDDGPARFYTGYLSRCLTSMAEQESNKIRSQIIDTGKITA